MHIDPTVKKSYLNWINAFENGKDSDSHLRRFSMLLNRTYSTEKDKEIVRKELNKLKKNPLHKQHQRNN